MSRDARDRLAAGLTAVAAIFCLALAFGIAVALLAKSRPVLATTPVTRLLLSSAWHPMKREFGLYPFVIGTLWVSGLAMAIAIPICLLTAVYISEYSHSRLRAAAKPLLDLLAGIPPVVFGLWGVLAIVPLVSKLAERSGTFSAGYSVLAGGIVLAIMIFPIVISVTEEVLRKVPMEARAASLALGATRWQTTKHVLLRAALPGVFAAVVLGFSRAFGETMAVLMVVGNVPALPKSLFDPAYPLPALIANNYGEMMSIPLYDSALMFAALVLLVVVLLFNLLATLVLRSVERRLA
ncbi:MAG: phosphate ABC transporter permease subunit PstC [Armatimonadota bacterium]